MDVGFSLSGCSLSEGFGRADQSCLWQTQGITWQIRNPSVPRQYKYDCFQNFKSMQILGWETACLAASGETACLAASGFVWLACIQPLFLWGLHCDRHQLRLLEEFLGNEIVHAECGCTVNCAMHAEVHTLAQCHNGYMITCTMHDGVHTACGDTFNCAMDEVTR